MLLITVTDEEDKDHCKEGKPNHGSVGLWGYLGGSYPMT